MYVSGTGARPKTDLPAPSWQPARATTTVHSLNYHNLEIRGMTSLTSSLDDELLYLGTESTSNTHVSDEDKQREKSRRRIIPIQLSSSSRILTRLPTFAFHFLFLIFLGVLAQQTANLEQPKKPAELERGCPPELVHSRSYRQFQLFCRTKSAVPVSAYEGIKDAMRICENRLRFHPWDCSNVGNMLLDPPILNYAYKESALVWALSSAGAVWGISTSCAQGWLPDCGCSSSHEGNQQQWEWTGCNIGVQYGISTSRKLLTRIATMGRSPLRTAEKHNLKAGRLAVKKTLISSCQCHGVSGSCQQKTCWKGTAPLDVIGNHIVDKYQRSRVVREGNSVRNADLLAFEQSPERCSRYSVYFGGQVRGRVCGWRNETHAYGDCTRLCCGRPIKIKHEVSTYKCDCKFIWCCQLECKECLRHAWISVCE